MILSSLRDTKKLAEKIGKKISKNDTLLFYGEIGVGKTTFARFLINNFEKENNLKSSEVLSPTFNISFEYDIRDLTIKHYDLYRLKNENDIKNIGLFEDSEKSINLIEWPELIKEKPLNRVDMFFEYTNNLNGRIINFKFSGRLKNHEF